jgi:DNA-binding XRE family transcriptional regulator
MTEPLHNYLRTCRRRVGLSQDEVALLLGHEGIKSATLTGRFEAGERLPSLEVALMYERIYGSNVREMFAGLYRQIHAQLRERARVLLVKVEKEPEGRRKTRRIEVLVTLIGDESIAIPVCEE